RPEALVRRSAAASPGTTPSRAAPARRPNREFTRIGHLILGSLVGNGPLVAVPIGFARDKPVFALRQGVRARPVKHCPTSISGSRCTPLHVGGPPGRGSWATFRAHLSWRRTNSCPAGTASPLCGGATGPQGPGAVS